MWFECEQLDETKTAAREASALIDYPKFDVHSDVTSTCNITQFCP